MLIRELFQIRMIVLLNYEDNSDRMQKLVKIFYNEIGKRNKMAPENIDYKQFRISDDWKTLYSVVGDKEIRITAKQGSATFLSLSSLVKEYNRAVGSGGTQAIRHSI